MDGIWFNHQTAQIFLLIYLTCFGSSMALFAVHFIYRYGAVNKDFQKSYLSGAKLAILYFCPVISGVFWGITCWVFMSESSETSDFMRPYLKQKFDLDIDQCTYIALYFWRPGPDGKVHPDIFSFIGVGILYLILSFSLFCVLYFGINCYLWISRKLGSLENQSQATKSLQTQLFYALLIQALIPFVLMYLPATIVFTFPMLNLDFDIKYPFMEITIALYPAIDPFPTILIIKHYRIAVIRILKCNRTNQISEDYSHGTSAVPKNMSNAVI
ncbi:hypothetical protein B9Z55_018063 [Caenorhabditis nigoni]|uniref:G-protein coupled receptors family 1 profile domain-containing protein n=2 Tax=Caenorhabditis nigoni TaxID=1611254 RepID=A0A2G5TCF0_9PELO|nr:hypothetical protein B9Z55_018063 [Caenorhabditis nigoni]